MDHVYPNTQNRWKLRTNAKSPFLSSSSSCKTLFSFLFFFNFWFPFLLESSRRSSNNHRNCQRNSITHLKTKTKTNPKTGNTFGYQTFLCTNLRFCFVFFSWVCKFGNLDDDLRMMGAAKISYFFRFIVVDVIEPIPPANSKSSSSKKSHIWWAEWTSSTHQCTNVDGWCTHGCTFFIHPLSLKP